MRVLEPGRGRKEAFARGRSGAFRRRPGGVRVHANGAGTPRCGDGILSHARLAVTACARGACYTRIARGALGDSEIARRRRGLGVAVPARSVCVGPRFRFLLGRRCGSARRRDVARGRPQAGGRPAVPRARCAPCGTGMGRELGPKGLLVIKKGVSRERRWGRCVFRRGDRKGTFVCWLPF